MFSNDRPVYVPIMLPSDLAALEQTPPQAAIMISAAYGGNPRLGDLIAAARGRAEMLLVDPKTPHFQFEGYMSMPDYRTLPYSPGRGALGTLWEPARFARAEARADLIESVFAVQRALGADLLLSPYFYVPHASHPWLETSQACAREAVSMSVQLPVGVPICVDIDALIDPQHLARIADVYADVEAAVFWVTIVNYDERLADPRDVHTVMAFLEALQATGVPVVLSHAGRTGLVAIARGAAGYAAGTHGLEHHPRGFFREAMGSRPANNYYLYECLFGLAVRRAQACLELEGPVAHPTCDCVACGDDPAVARMVSRRLSVHSMLRRMVELEALTAIDPAERRAHLIERFDDALRRAPEMSEALVASGSEPIAAGEFHYLEVLREAAGGPQATIPLRDGYD